MGVFFLDERMKCFVYQYLLNSMHDLDSQLQKLSDYVRSGSVDSLPSDYSEYACVLSKKMQLNETINGLMTIFNMDLPSNTD